MNLKNILPTYLLELHEKFPKDIKRKVCKQCGDLGHGITSTYCKINILKKDLLKQKVTIYINYQLKNKKTYFIIILDLVGEKKRIWNYQEKVIVNVVVNMKKVLSDVVDGLLATMKNYIKNIRKVKKYIRTLAIKLNSKNNV